MARQRGLRRELTFLMFIGGFGLLVLPFLVYLAGVLTLGPYDGGLGAFLASLYTALFRLQPSAWLLLLGPYLLFWPLRLLSRRLRPRRT